MQKTRWDYQGLSTDDKSALPFFNQHDVNGTTFLAIDTADVYIYYEGEWVLLGGSNE